VDGTGRDVRPSPAKQRRRECNPPPNLVPACKQGYASTSSRGLSEDILYECSVLWRVSMSRATASAGDERAAKLCARLDSRHGQFEQDAGKNITIQFQDTTSCGTRPVLTKPKISGRRDGNRRRNGLKPNSTSKTTSGRSATDEPPAIRVSEIFNTTSMITHRNDGCAAQRTLPSRTHDCGHRQHAYRHRSITSTH